MKLSGLVLAASSCEAAFPASACNSLSLDPSVCSKSCEAKSLGRKVTKRIMYGNNSWVYQVYGMEKMSKAEAKESYRNVVQYDVSKCGKSALSELYNGLVSNQVRMELLEKTDGMMSIEHAYANFDEESDEYAAGCFKAARGLWIQFKKDATVRETAADDFMNGKKTRDWYYLQIQNVNGFSPDADLSAINTCLKSGKMHRMKEEYSEFSDMTKCIAYKACKKEPDWSNETETAPETTAVPTQPAQTTAAPTEIPLPDPNLPNFNDMDYSFSCVDSDEVASKYQKCTLTAENGAVFHGRSKNGVVEFKPIRYAKAPIGDLRWKAPVLNFDYPEPVQGHLDEGPICTQGNGGVEDCLFLTIEVTQSALENKEKLPILYYIHGGGFNAGSGMGSQKSAAFNQGVVAVSVNYRLGAWGFLYLNEKEEDQEWQSNWGLLDQQAGLKWVHAMAGLFGGNRDMVTLTGGSAGSESCWRQFTIPSSWPYFNQMAPVGIGLLTGIKGPHKIQKLTNKFYEVAGCAQNDLACMRQLTNEDVIKFANQSKGSVGKDNVAMVLNGAFGPTHRSDVMPDTLFNAVKNRQVRPGTPLMWTYARDETWGMTNNWILGRAGSGQKLADMKTEIEDAIAESGFNNPSPYFNIWLERMFGEQLGSEMIEQFGCGEPGTNCHEQIARFTVATQWTCSTRYALERSYGRQNAMNVLYPVEVAEPSCNDDDGEKTKACHGADGKWVRGSQSGKNDLGTWATKAYGAFYTTGSIPGDKNYSLKTWEEMDYNDINQISKERYGQFGIRREDCAALDKLQEAFDWYNWGISEDHQDSMNESTL